MTTQFNLFDQVQLVEPVELVSDFSNALEEKLVAPVGTLGTIVEVLGDSEAFLVEFFGDWIKVQSPHGLERAKEGEQGAFRETIGLETVYPKQMVLQHRASVKVNLFSLLDQMPESMLEEVQSFAESLQYQHSNT